MASRFAAFGLVSISGLALASLAVFAGSGCSRSTPSGAAGAAGSAAPAVVDGRTSYVSRCGACHGDQGLGDGPAARSLNPRPRSFADAAWQESVDDAHLAKVILGGGPAVGKSPLMPPQGDLQHKPDELQALVAHVRSLRAAR